MKKIFTIILFTIGFITITNAQGITNKLGGNTANVKFDVTDSNDALLFRVQGDKGALFTGTLGTGTIPATGEGTRLMWYPKKAAFRVGYVNGTQWDDVNIGEYSTAIGENTIASGENSTAMGNSTRASGRASTAMSWYTNAESFGSVVLGRLNVGGGSATTWIDSDPLFEIGIGAANRANAMTVLKNGNLGIKTATPTVTLEVSGTDAMIVPIGTTAEQPSAPTAGMIRFNSTTSKFEGYTGSVWVDLH